MTAVIAVPGNEEQAAQLARRLGTEVLATEVRQFPDGEIYVRIDQPITGRDVVLVRQSLSVAGGTVPDRRVPRIDRSRPRGAQGRAGRAVPRVHAPGRPVQDRGGRHLALLRAARLRCRRLDGDGRSAPPSPLVARGPLHDPHDHRAVRSRDRRWIASEIEHPFLIGPDAESVQWVSAVADGCGAPFAILEKTRRGDRDVSISKPPGEWNGHTPVVIDDIVSTGKTMIEATRQLRAAGSAAPMCVAIHAVFADSVLEELRDAGAAGIVTCDTIAHASNRICVSDSIAEAAKRYLEQP